MAIWELPVSVTVRELGELNNEKGNEPAVPRLSTMVLVCTGTPAAVPVTVMLATPKLAKLLPAGVNVNVNGCVLPGKTLAVVGDTETPAGSGPKVIVTGVVKEVPLVTAVIPITTLELASNVSGALGLVNWDKVKGGAPW